MTGTSTETGGTGTRDDRRGRVGRRQFLAATGAGATGVVAGCSAGGESDGPPPLSKGFFKVTDTGAIEFELVAAGDLDETRREAAIAALSTDANGSTVERAEGTLEFIEHHTIDDEQFDGIVDDHDVSGTAREELRNYNADVSLPEFDDRSIRGRIPDAATVPPDDVRFTGCPTTVPAITYAGPRPGPNTRERFVLQFHDGFAYRFPRSDRPYELDGRYDIGWADEGTVEVNAVAETTRTFHVGENVGYVDTGGSPSVLTPAFSHRAHPYLAALRALAERRAVQLNLVARGAAKGPDYYAKRFLGATGETVTGILGTLGPTPPDSLDPADVAVSASFAIAPIFLIALGPVGLAVGEVLLAGAGLALALPDLRDWGETLGEFADSMARAQFDELQYDPQCPPEDGPLCPVPSETSIGWSNMTAVMALSELSALLAQFGPAALATGGRFDRHLTTYRNVIDEIAYQNHLFRKFTGGKRFDSEAFGATVSSVFPQHEMGRSVPRAEAALLDGVETAFAGESECEPGATTTATSTSTTPAPEREPVTGRWSQTFLDAGNTGGPSTTAPSAFPDEVWAFDTEEDTETDGHVGEAFAPVVAGETLYVCAAGGAVIALDLATGDARWLFDDLGDEPLGLAVDDRHVYAVTTWSSTDSPFVYALARDRPEVDWSFTLSEPERLQMTNPTLADGTLYVVGSGSKQHGDLFAFDAATGDVRWRQRVLKARPGIYGVPAVSEGTVYVRASGRVAAYDATSGRTRWEFDDRVGIGSIGTAPVVAGDTLVFADSPPGDHRQSLFGYTLSGDGGKPDRAWVTGEGLDLYQWLSAPAVQDGTAYAPLQSWGLQAVSLSDGRAVWEGPHRLPVDAPELFLTSPVATENAVFYGATSGDLFAVDPDSGETMYWIDDVVPGSTVGVNHRFLNSYAVTGGRIYTTGQTVRAWR